MSEAFPLVDDNTLVLQRPVRLAVHQAVMADIYADDYNAAHAGLLANEWLLGDPLGNSLGGDQSMQDMGELMTYQGHNPWTDFPEHQRHFPTWQMDVETRPHDHLVDDANAWAFPLGGSFQERWENMVNEEIWQTVTWNMFLLGWMQRVTVRLAQHRLAKVIENLFCLDNRGRPRLS